jgi:hypothetical protein
MGRASVAFCLSAAIVTAAGAAHAQATDDTTRHTNAAISAGGSARWRFERYEHPGFGAGTEDRDGYFLQRYLVHLDVTPHETVRLFGELQSSTVAGRTGGARRTDRNVVDLHQAFAELRVRFGEAHDITVRAGRQEVEFGSSRLVSTRDGLNVRLSFDGVRVMARARRWRAWAFAIRPVEIDPGAFDDGRERTTMWGVSAGNAPDPTPTGNLAVYVAWFRSPTGRYAQGIDVERRTTLGVRAWGTGARWDYNLEPIVQWGRFGAGPIRAWGVATDLGYRWRHAPLTPRLGVRVDATSGDRDVRAPSLETFNPLFSGVSYSGLAGLVGPPNAWDLTPSLSVTLRPDLIVTGGAAYFSRTRATDGIYGISGTLEREPGTSLSSHVGTQATAQAVWSATPRLTATVTVSYFLAGAFLRQTPPGDDVLYTTTYITCRF